jgi:hypothetical protein
MVTLHEDVHGCLHYYGYLDCCGYLVNLYYPDSSDVIDTIYRSQRLNLCKYLRIVMLCLCFLIYLLCFVLFSFFKYIIIMALFSETQINKVGEYSKNDAKWQ